MIIKPLNEPFGILFIVHQVSFVKPYIAEIHVKNASFAVTIHHQWRFFSSLSLCVFVLFYMQITSITYFFALICSKKRKQKQKKYSKVELSSFFTSRYSHCQSFQQYCITEESIQLLKWFFVHFQNHCSLQKTARNRPVYRWKSSKCKCVDKWINNFKVKVHFNQK